MTFSMIYSKTERGSAEVRSRSNALTPVARRVLIMIDGRRTEDELARVVRDGELEGILATLRSLGMIEEVGFADLPEPVWDAEDDDDTVLIEPPTVRAELGLALATAAPPPPTLHAAVSPAAAASARPLAPSAPAAPVRAAVAVERRAPPAPSMPAAVVAAAASVKAAASATTNAAPASAAASVVAPPPAQGATSPASARPPLLARVFAPEKGGAPAQSSPAPEPPPAGLEETKKLAVRALYERLGPYGEAPAARIQDCKTLEALQEQLKHAYQRIITFRGESAAREYLASIGMA